MHLPIYGSNTISELQSNHGYTQPLAPFAYTSFEDWGHSFPTALRTSDLAEHLI